MPRRIGQLSPAGIDALLNLMGFGTAKQSLLRHYQSGDGSNYSLTLARAIAAGQRTIRIPEGSFTFNTPTDYVSGLRIIGSGGEIKTSGVNGTKINAPNGFLKNDNTTRKQIVLEDLHIIGNNTASTVGVDGPFGGVIKGCKIEGYPDLIRNLSGYLVMYKRLSFADAARGLNTADANGTVVEQCHFNADVGIQITTRFGTPQTGVNSGLPLIIRESNFNASDATTVCVQVRGQLHLADNYFEKFSGSAPTTFVDIEVNRFDHQGLILEGSELNGQGANVTAIAINGSHAGLDNPCEGRITTNRIIGCAHDIVYGANNRIPGLKIYGNFGAVIENSYQAQHVTEDNAWTYVTLGSNFQTSSATAVDVTGMGFTPVANATYEIDGMLMVRADVATTAAPRPGVAWPTGSSADSVVMLQAASSAQATTPRYGNSSAVVELASTAIADTTGSWPVSVKGLLVMGASPGGTFRITLKSATAASNVTMRANSYFKYKRLA